MSRFIPSLFRGKHNEERRESSNQRRFGLARIFDHEELRKATNNYDSDREVGNGAFGRVYLGVLPDGQRVAVKKLHDDGPWALNRFLNEVTVFSQIRHNNLITLYGCTDPISQSLVLVYEFMPNGTLRHHIHGLKPALTWAVRIKIAIQIAEGLAYLHAREPLIIYRNVASSNMLLDNAFDVKICGFGICHIAPWSTTHVRATTVTGMMAYLDPEYIRTGRLSDKIDVYSFGVVLVELISGLVALDTHRERDDFYLNETFLSKITKDEFDAFVDPKLDYHVDQNVRTMIHLVAELARRCLQPTGDARPPMAEVLNVLKGIKDGRNVVEEVGVGALIHRSSAKTRNMRSENQSFQPIGSWKLWNTRIITTVIKQSQAITQTQRFTWFTRDGLHPRPPENSTKSGIKDLQSLTLFLTFTMDSQSFREITNHQRDFLKLERPPDENQRERDNP